MMMQEDFYFPFVSEPPKVFNINDVANVYRHIDNDRSKTIFMNRLNYSITGDFQYIRNIVLQTKIGHQFYDMLSGITDGAYIYGAGRRGRRLALMFPDICWRGFIDGYKEGECDGLKIFRPQDVPGKPTAKIVISNMFDEVGIIGELTNMGFSSANIISMNEWDKKSAHNIYFDTRCVNSKKLSEVGCFVDVGSCDGKDSICFLEKHGKDKRIIAIEPEKNNYGMCCKNLESYDNAKVVWGGAGKSNCFADIGGEKQSAHILMSDENGDNNTPVYCLDDILSDEAAGFIKMDIEGSEADALVGAYQTIKSKKPIMAISTYHKREDIIALPQMLLEINDNYRLCFEHYSVGVMDTVMYAVAQE